MRDQGFEVAIRGGDYRVPATCASCNAPRKTSVVLQTSRQSGNITTILRMRMPYCASCAARVPGAGFRMMALFSFVTVVAVVLPGLAGLVSIDGASVTAVAAGGAVIALVLATLAALVIPPGAPAPPATARGEAVTVKSYAESGDLVLFCTNGAWAERFAAGNTAPMRPGSRLRLVAPLAVAWCATLGIAMTTLAWYGEEMAPHKRSPAAAPAKPGGKSPQPPKRK